MKITIVEDKKYPKMYRLKWSDKVISKDCYSLARAKEHQKRLELGIIEPMSIPTDI